MASRPVNEKLYDPDRVFVCRTCKKPKPRRDFYVGGPVTRGCGYDCKACEQERDRKHRETRTSERRERDLTARRRWRGRRRPQDRRAEVTRRKEREASWSEEQRAARRETKRRCEAARRARLAAERAPATNQDELR
jgi:hypothetical protein